MEALNVARFADIIENSLLLLSSQWHDENEIDNTPRHVDENALHGDFADGRIEYSLK